MCIGHHFQHDLMLNRPLSQPVTRLSGHRLMAEGQGYQYRGVEGKLGWLHPQERQTKHTCGLWNVADPTGRGAWPKNTSALAINYTTRVSRTQPMDHLPPASSQPKDSGSSSSFTQEGVQQSDSVRWCVEIRVTNARLIYWMIAENCPYTFIYYIYRLPIICYHNEGH